MVGILVSATWGEPEEPVGLWHAIYSVKWLATGLFAIVLGVLLVKWFRVKDIGICLPGGGDGHHQRQDFWTILGLIPLCNKSHAFKKFFQSNIQTRVQSGV